MNTAAKEPRIKSADRTLALIEFVAERGTTTFNEVLVDLGIPRSSAHGLLHTLVGSNWLHHDPVSKRYSLGLRAWQIGQSYSGHHDLANIATPVMDALARRTGETVQLAILDGIENVYIAISESTNPMRLVSRVGMRLHAHATGIGKALLGLIDPADAEARLRAVELPRLTARTITDVDRLMGVITDGRENGYCLDDEEFVSGCRCVAVPLTSERSAGVTSAMSVTMPTSRTDGSWPGSIVKPLREAAAEIRGALGADASL